MTLKFPFNHRYLNRASDWRIGFNLLYICSTRCLRSWLIWFPHLQLANTKWRPRRMAEWSGECGGCLGHRINRKIDWYITCPGWMDIGLDQVCSVCFSTSPQPMHIPSDGNWLICCIRLPIRISTNWVFAFQSGKKVWASCVCLALESGIWPMLFQFSQINF